MEDTLILEAPRLVMALALTAGEYALVLLSVAADLWSGVRKARRRGVARRSKALRLTIDKLCRYYNALLALSVIDAMQIAAVEYMRVCCGREWPLLPIFTLLGSVGIAIIEVKSIFEKASEKEQAEAEAAARAVLNLLKGVKDDNLLERLKEMTGGNASRP